MAIVGLHGLASFLLPLNSCYQQVVAVKSGSRTLKDAINEAMRDWVTNVETTHYCIGSAVGPHPFPLIVRDLQSVMGHEARKDVSLGARLRRPKQKPACDWCVCSAPFTVATCSSWSRLASCLTRS